MSETITSRRRFLALASAGALCGLAIASDAIVLEPNHPNLVRVDIPMARLPREFDGFTIVQLSDFHYDPYFSVVPISKAVQMSNSLAPDLVVLTGDFVSTSPFGGIEVNRRAALQADPCAQVLCSLRARYGVWAALGNHDAFSDSSYIVATLRRAGIQVLKNSAIPLDRSGQRLWLAGVDDVLVGNPDIAKTLRGIGRNEPVVLLAHEPDFADMVAKYPIDVQLSGHSHGGQVRLPMVGAVYLPRMARKYPKGLRQIGSLTLYTNVGIGTLQVPVRWNCPPEVTLITLRSVKN